MVMYIFNFVLRVASLLLEASDFFSVREGYKVRSDVNITLEFRTTAAHGVLLGVSSAKVDAIGLEIVHGKVGCPVQAHGFPRGLFQTGRLKLLECMKYTPVKCDGDNFPQNK